MNFVFVFMFVMLGILLFFVSIFLLEDLYVGKLPSDNKLKIWWRKHLIGELPPDQDDY